MKILWIFWMLMVTGAAFASDFLTTAEIEIGMKGYGLSVFKGWEPERFEVEIIDVIRRKAPKRDLILARVSGCNLEKSGVIAGMSGSPVYINVGGKDRLIGAVAYTWSFLVEPICGITPIHQMLEEKDLADSEMRMGNALDDDRMKQIVTPLMISGFEGEGFRFLSQFMLTKFGISADTNATTDSPYLPVKTGTVSIKDAPTNGLKGGDAVAVNLVDGDFTMQSVGTVTYVSNKDVYIFGHPMNLSGNSVMPISRAYIYTVIPNQSISFKIGASSEPLGATLYDGKDAVYCRLDTLADMVPTQLRFRTWNKKQDYNIRIINNKYWYNGLLTSVIGSVLNTWTGSLDDMRMNIRFKIEFNHQKKRYSLTNEFTYAFNPSYFNAWYMMMDLSSYLYYVYNSDLGDFKITRVDVDLEVEKGVLYYVLQNVTIDKKNYYPGDEMRLKVTLKKYKGETVEGVLRLKIPEGMESGQYKVFVGNDNYYINESYKAYPSQYLVQNLDDFMRIGTMRQSANSLNAWFFDTKLGLQIGNRNIDSFPVNYIRHFYGDMDRMNPAVSGKAIMDKMVLDGGVFGTYQVNFNVVDKKTVAVE